MAVKPIDHAQINKVIAVYRGKPGELLAILEELQRSDPSNYLSPEIIAIVAKELDLPPAQIYSVLTFYAFFNLKPQGKHTIVICRGTACHTRGSRELLETLKLLFDFEEEDLNDTGKVFMTTKDRQFTIKTVACFGQCALAPVMEIDGVVHGNMTIEKMKKIIKEAVRTKKVKQ
jgi:NADH-quinone oxidoreductase subunit E